ncbi:hypothetical protein T4B_11096 [Trichinella pseudospiralis]|uniref:Uncharacterized protein n=1 Tax=Trichinella pseudospiralis TaxID=6337 RepID=A0A0V1J0L6_TRIPS|nr:hypothetical protein T4A_11431 [Trichinella pseudospiralis]KRY99798.1 hypothetical protein T4B_11096 [Trichinella pseudospiralis]KRZ28523.1 hypothetical protein T4C_11758 [Trichinella pseudospiralis]
MKGYLFQKYHALSDKTLPVTIGFQSGNSDQKIYQLPFAKRASPKFRKFENFQSSFPPKSLKIVFSKVDKMGVSL